MTDAITRHILIVDDISAQVDELTDALRQTRIPMRIRVVGKLSELVQALRGDTWHVVIWSMHSGGLPLEAVITALSEQSVKTPVIALLRKYFREVAVECLQLGATEVFAADETELIVARVDREFAIGRCEQARALIEQEFTESEARFDHLLETVDQPTAFIHFGSFINSNPAFRDLLGIKEAATLEGVSLLDLVNQDERDSLRRVLNDLCEGKPVEQPVFCSVHLACNGADPQRVEIELTACMYNQEQCVQLLAYVTQTSTREESVPTALMAAAPANSAVTPVERFFLDLDETVEALKNNRVGGCAGVVVIELDRFSVAKQNMGIAASDSALRRAGEIIGSALPEPARMSRIGSDAFVCLLGAPQDPATLQLCADQICQTLAATPVRIGPHTLTLTASIGAAILDGQTLGEQVLAHAEAACAVAQNAGGNMSHVYSPSADRTTSESIDQKWAKRLTEALKGDHFQLAYQPVVSLHAPPGERYEALLRLRSPGGELDLPQMFLRTAKDMGIEKEIDRWVVRHALQQIKARHDLKRPVSLLTKVSDASVHDPSFPDWLRETLNTIDTPGPQLTIEIDALLLLHAPAETLHFALAMKGLGLDIALDHCDTDSECLRLFGTFPARYWKIDGKIIAKLAADRLLQVRLKKLAEVARATGIQTIAVCVEDADTLALLWSEGVNFIQGYYVQGPEAGLSYDFAASA